MRPLRPDVAGLDASATHAGGGRLASLDGWRGLAIALVLIGHFVPLAGWSLDSLGVDLFFVLSGRLIAGVLFVDHAPLGTFVWRRLARVGPSLLVFVLVAAPLHVVAGRPLPGTLAPLTFTANYVYAARGEPLFFGHLWSLCVEEHSYVVLAIIALAYRRWGGSAPLLLGALGIVCLLDLALSESVFGQRDVAVLWRTDARAGVLILSGAMHLLVRRRLADWRLVPGFGAVPLLALAAGVVLHHEGFPELVRYAVAGLFLGIAVNTLEAAPSGLRAQLTNPLLLALGRWSYSIYLWQQPFFVAAYFAGPVWRAPMLLAGVGLGVLSFVAIERPAWRWLIDCGNASAWRRGPFSRFVSGGAA